MPLKKPDIAAPRCGMVTLGFLLPIIPSDFLPSLASDYNRHLIEASCHFLVADP
jgi:hypothetical protein